MRFTAALLAMLLCSAGAAQAKEELWVVLAFKGVNGYPHRLAGLSEDPKLTVDRCQSALPQMGPDLVKKTIEREPLLRGYEFVGARCVLSDGNPLTKEAAAPSRPAPASPAPAPRAPP